MFKYILYVNGRDRGVLYADDDVEALNRGEVIASVLGFYVPDDIVEVERF